MNIDVKDIQKRIHSIKERLDPERAEREKRVERKKGLAKGLALGSLLGGVAALFFAPDSGKNTRAKAKEELEKTKEKLEVGLAEGKVKLEEGREKFSEVFEEKKEVFNEKIIEIKEKVKSTSTVEPNIVEEEDFDVHMDIDVEEEAK